MTATASGSESDCGMGSLRSTRFASSGFGSSGCALVQAEMTGGPHGDHSTGSEDHDQGSGVQAWSSGSNAHGSGRADMLPAGSGEVHPPPTVSGRAYPLPAGSGIADPPSHTKNRAFAIGLLGCLSAKMVFHMWL